MPKVTSKLQLTVPKAIADQYGIRPGDDLQWVPAGEVIRVIPRGRSGKREDIPTITERLQLFDSATERQRRREATLARNGVSSDQSHDRGWKREDLYTRGSTD